MAITVTLYTIAKRRNSTKLPTTTGLPMSCELKEECSLINPSIYLLQPSGVNLLDYNYAYIPTFGRYYWIQDVIWLNGRYEMLLRVDVLASYKASIGASSQYVARSASSSNGLITDTLYPKLNSVSTNSLLLGTQAMSVSGGYFALSVIRSYASSGLAGNDLFFMNNRTTVAFFNDLFATTGWTDITELSAGLQKAIIDPFQYVVSLRWFPKTPPTAQLHKTSKVTIGGFWEGFDASQWDYAYIYKPTQIPTNNVTLYTVNASQIPMHPQISRGRYLAGEDYSEYYLMITGYGRIKIPNYAIIYGNGLRMVETIDYVTGDSILNVYTGNGSTPVATAHGKAGVEIMLSTTKQDIIGAINSVGSVVNSAVNSGLNPISTITNGVTGIANAAKAFAPEVTKQGETGSFVQFGEYGGSDGIQCIFHLIAEEDQSDLGRPLCGSRTISTLSGYVLCVNGHLAITGTETEQAELEQYLNSGFFYE